MNASTQSAAMTLPLDPMTMPLQGLHVIEASAGTGKTWTLAALYVRLVLGHLRQRPQGEASGNVGLYPPQILVMTFTEAATAELRGRIRERLAQAARFFRDSDRGAVDADDFLCNLRDAFPPTQWPECAYRLDMAAQWMDDAAIFTIHGWSSRMLKQHAFDSASLFQQSRVEDSERLKLTAVQDYWRQWFYPLPVAQLSALKTLGKTPDEFLEVLGKRWAMADKAPQSTVFSGDAPDTLLQKWGAWKERLEALQAMARPLWTPDTVTMVNEAAVSKTLKGYRPDWLQGWLAQMQLWSQGESVELKTLERFSVTVLVSKGWAGAQAHIVFAHIEALCDHMRAEPEVAEGLQAHAAHEIGLAYRNTKAQLAQFDFSDLLQCLYRALQAPDGRLASAIRQQYPIALVDEFQDTDPWQYGSLSKIYGESTRPDTGLIMIGDPKQAIYSFRGADLDTYLEARAQAQAIHTLSGNFRSTPGVVAAVNHVFSQVEKPFGDVPFEPVVARNEAVHPLQLGAATQPAMTVWHQHSAKPPRKDVFLRQMAALFATQMVELLNQGRANPGSREPGTVAPGDMAVLVRGWREARAIRQALSARGVRSVYLSERDSVFDTAEATDLWRILLAVSNPRSTAWLRAALTTRLWGLEWAQLEALFQDERAWDSVVDQFHQWQTIWQRQGFLPMLHHLLHAQSIPARLFNPRHSQSDSQNQSGERQLTNLLHLGDLLQTVSLNLQGEGALIRYLEAQLQNPTTSGDTAQLRLESDANLVQVITVHKAKGLQYPLVFLPFVSAFMAEKKDSGKDDALRLAEDIRLLYVALTRAEKALWVGLAQVKGDVDGPSPKAKSAVSVLLQRQSADDLTERLTAWLACQDIVVAPAPAPNDDRYTPTALDKVWKPASEPKRLLKSHWWSASFSALVQHPLPTLTHEAALDTERDSRLADAQVDSALVEAEEGPVVPALPLVYNAFPAGSAYGTLLHDLLEWQTQRDWPAALEAPSAAVAQEWRSLVARKSQRLKLNEEHVALLNVWVQQTLLTDLPIALSGAPVTPLKLAALTRATAWPEMGFAMTVQKMPALQIDQLIQQQVLMGQPRLPLQTRTLEGMLIGFMDLVLEHEGRYYVMDYKSNRLPAYDTAHLQAAILSHRYDVQYTLYLLAVHRLLKSRLPDYDYDQHIGGALYLFLRGIDQPGAGLFADKPPRELIESLDAALAGSPAPTAKESEAK